MLSNSTVVLLIFRCAVCSVVQSCPTLRNPVDCSLPGSSDHGDSPGKDTGEYWLPCTLPASAGKFFTTEHLEALCKYMYDLTEQLSNSTLILKKNNNNFVLTFLCSVH